MNPRKADANVTPQLFNHFKWQPARAAAGEKRKASRIQRYIWHIKA